MTQTWTEAFLGSSFSGNFTSVALDNGNNAIATTGSSMVRSTNGGVSWAPLSSPGNASVSTVFHNGAQFISITSGNAVYLSPDGLTWTQATGTSGTLTGYIYNNTSKTLIITGSATGTNVNLFRLPNTATTFTQTVTNAAGPNQGPGNRRGYFSNGGAWLAPHNGTTNTLYKSTDDGVTWTSVLVLTGDVINQVEYNGLVYCLLGSVSSSGNNLQYSSTDGTTWTLQHNVSSSTAPFVVESIVFRNTFYSNNQGNIVTRSTDAINWTAVSVGGTITNIIDMWVHNSILYVAGDGGVSSSPQGTTWTNELANTNLGGDAIRGNTVPSNILFCATDESNSFGASLWTPIRAAGGTTANLTWDASTVGTYPLASYDILRAVDAGSPSVLKTVGSTTLSTTDNTIASGHSYTYGISATDNMGNESGEGNTIAVMLSAPDPIFLTAGGSAGSLVGFYDGTFNSGSLGAAYGTLTPAQINGSTVGELSWGFASHSNNSIFLGLYGASPSFTYITYTDANGVLQTYLSSQAQVSSVTPTGQSYTWDLNQNQAFTILSSTAITWQSTAETDFTLTVGINSNGPFAHTIGGDGSGYYTNAMGGSGSAGSISPTTLNGNVLEAVCNTGSPGSRVVAVVVQGTVTQDFFYALSFVAATARIQTFSTPAAHFDTLSFSGFSVWTWPIITDFPFGTGGTITARFV